MLSARLLTFSCFFLLLNTSSICQQNKYVIRCETDSAEIDDISGLKMYDGAYYLNHKSSYLFVASKEGFRSECFLITPKIQKAFKGKEFVLPALRKFPTKSSIGKFIHANEMKWDKLDMLYKEKYVDDYFEANPEILRSDENPVTELEDRYGDLTRVLNNQLYYMELCDTSHSSIQDNGGRCLLDVSILELEYEYAHYPTTYYNQRIDLVRVHTKLKFDLKDAFGVDIFSKELDVKSVIYVNDEKVNLLSNALQEAIMNFMELNELKNAIIQREEEANNITAIPTLDIPNSEVYASSIPQFLQSAVTLYSKDGHGSGCIISEDGYIVTNYHVVGKDSVFQIILNRGDTLQAKVIRTDWKYDLALLKAPLKNEVAFRISKEQGVGLADRVYALGTPADVSLGQTISSGIISARRNFFGRDYYQTDARLNGGNSGGALVNEQGELIGVVCSKIIGLGIEGVGFVIPGKYIFERLRISVNGGTNND